MKSSSKIQLQQFIKSYQLKNLNFICECSANIEDLCVQNCVEPSLHCRNRECNSTIKQHKFCRAIKLHGFTELLQRRFEHYRTFLQSIQHIEQEYIEKMRKERENLYNKIIFRQFQGEQIVALEEIFIRKNFCSINGDQIQAIYKKLLLQNKLKEENSKKLNQYGSQFGKLFTQFSELKQILTMQASNESKLLSVSKILNDKQIWQSKFILNSLNNPKQLKLLFRASQNQFSAAKFHRICDGIPYLLVLIKTEFGKVIGGFNSIGWKSQLHNKYSVDNENKCFLFSATLKQKMELTQPQYAIWNHRQYGPVFGYDCDLYLENECNHNNRSGSLFPTSYNFTSRPYTKNQQTNKLFSGSSTKKFNVDDYEVFLVIQ